VTKSISDLAALVGSKRLAKSLLDRTTLRHLAECPLTELMELMPQTAAERVHAALRLGRAVLAPELPEKLEDSADGYRYLYPHLTGRERERFVVVACDTKLRPIATHVAAEGGPTSVDVSPSDVFAIAVRHCSHRVLVGHNHPSGDPTPSSEDVQLTLRLLGAGMLLGIEVLDHVIVGGERWVSLREREDGPFDRFRADLTAK